MSKLTVRRLRGAAAVIAIAIMLSGCGQQPGNSQMTNAALPELPATLPLASGPESLWPFAPAVSSLPASAPLRTVRVANPDNYYGYADAAYDFQDALGDAPPDYYFDYGDVDPWAWEGYDQSLVFVEPINDGHRYYYYRPGADRPYFVRDPSYGYGYDGDALAVIYDNFGAVVPYTDYGPRADYAARYYMRGRDMFAASRRAERRAVAAANWAARSPSFEHTQVRWTDLRDRQPQWRDFRKRGAPERATYWREESVRRQSDTRRFEQWRSQGFRSAPPPRAIPQAWTKARWAGDEKRFLPARAERVRPTEAQPQRSQRLMGKPERPRGDRDDAGQPVINAPSPDRGNRGFAGDRRPMPQAEGPFRREVGPARPDKPENRGANRGNGNGRVEAMPPRVQPQPQPADVRPERGNRQQVERPRRVDQLRPPRVEGRNNHGGGRESGKPREQASQPQPQVQAQPQPRPQPQAESRPDRRGGNGNGRGPSARPAAPQQAETPRPQPQAAPRGPEGGGGHGGKGGNGNGGGKHDRGGG